MLVAVVLSGSNLAPPVLQALTEDICSLRADVERLTFSVLWEVTPPEDDGSGMEVVSVHFTKVQARAAVGSH